MTLLLILALLCSLLGLGLAVTIPFTMPTSTLSLIRTGATELSPWLVGLSALGGFFSLIALLGGQGRGRAWAVACLLATAAGVAGIVFAALPLTQLSGAAEKADAAMREGLGSDYTAKLPPAGSAMLRPTQFSLDNFVKGIAISVDSVHVTMDIPYRTVNGHTLLLDRYEPPGQGPHPGLLVIHGGSWRNGDKGEYTQASYYFAERGYVVYDIQYRLSGEAPFPAQLEDVECALGYMREHAAESGLDPERVVTFGRSAGAHLALLSAYRAARDPQQAGCGKPATVKATVAYYPPTDLLDDYLHPAQPDLIDGRGVIGAFMGGTPEQVPQRYAEATPQHWLDRPVPPTLLVMAGADQLVLPRNAPALSVPSRAAGNKVVTVTIPWSGHGFDFIFQGPGSQLALFYWERFMLYALSQP